MIYARVIVVDVALQDIHPAIPLRATQKVLHAPDGCMRSFPRPRCVAIENHLLLEEWLHFRHDRAMEDAVAEGRRVDDSALYFLPTLEVIAFLWTPFARFEVEQQFVNHVFDA